MVRMTNTVMPQCIGRGTSGDRLRGSSLNDIINGNNSQTFMMFTMNS